MKHGVYINTDQLNPSTDLILAGDIYSTSTRELSCSDVGFADLWTMCKAKKHLQQICACNANYTISNIVLG